MKSDDRPEAAVLQVQEICLNCKQPFRFEEIMLWGKEKITCPHCGFAFIIVK